MSIPVLLTLGALGGVSWLHHPVLEGIFLTASVGIAAWALWPGYQRHHRLQPLFFAALGLAFVTVGQLSPEAWEHWLTACGGLLIATAHGLNWHYLSRGIGCVTMERHIRQRA